MSISPHSSIVVLEESPYPRGSSRTNFQVLVLVLVLESQVLDNNTDGKRPDGVTLIPWKDGRCVTHMGLHNDRYDGTILPSCDISDVGCSSRSGGGQEDSQVCPIDAGIFVHGDLQLKPWKPSTATV